MRNRLHLPRLLPIVLVCVCGVLVFKAVSVLTEVAAEEAMPTSSSRAAASAAFTTQAGAPASKGANNGSGDAADSGNESDAAPATHGAAKAPGRGAPRQAGPAGGENGLLAEGAGEFSEEELKLLHKLADRREALAARARDIDRREALLNVAEARIAEKIAQLEELRIVLESLVEKHDAEQQRQFDSLVKIYENMKPKDAARIFEEMDMVTLLPVVARMKERKLAAIMAEMNPSKAKEVTVELSQRRRLIDQPAAFSQPQG